MNHNTEDLEEDIENNDDFNPNNSDVSSVKLVTITSPTLKIKDINHNLQTNINSDEVSKENLSGNMIGIGSCPSTDGYSYNSGEYQANKQNNNQLIQNHLKKERMKNEKLMCITHVSLNLDELQMQQLPTNNWKYIAIRKSPFSNLNSNRNG